MRGVGGIGRDAAGKTGTTDDYATAWFAGFTPDLAGAVSIGDPRGSQEHKLTGVTIGGRYYGVGVRRQHPRADLEGHDAGGAEERRADARSPRSTRSGSAAAARTAGPRRQPRDGDGAQEAGPDNEEGAIGDADLGDGGGGPRG